MFTKHLATMYKAGIPLTESLETLILQTKSAKFKQVLQGTLADVDNGQSLAKALAKYPKIFDDFYISLINVSEESGTLEDNLEFMAGQLTKDNSLRKKIRGALVYPGIVVGIMVLMGVFISFFILPKLIDFFSSFDIELPFTTKVLLFIANAFKYHGLLIIVSAVSLVVVFRIAITLAPVKRTWHRVLLKMPIFGQLIAFGQVARFTRNLGTLIKSGVPIAKSLDITAETMSNLKFEKDLKAIASRLTKGKNIASAMENPEYWEFPPIVSKMISVGEKSGKLDEVLLYLSNFYEDEIDDLSKNLSTILEPVLLVIIAVMVGFVALSIISPIYQLTGSIGRR